MSEAIYKPETPEGEFVKRFKLSYDVQAIPQGLGVDMLVKLADSGFIFYDSDKGNRPKLYVVNGDVQDDVPVFVDTKGKEVDIDNLKKQWEDEEFWRKELYMCKNSPIYYFQNYFSPNYKPTQAELEQYLKDIGMEAKDDSGEVGEKTPEQIKEERKSFADSIKLEDLKNLLPVRESLKEDYEKETTKLKNLVSSNHDLSGKLDKPIKDKVISDILKIKPKEAPKDLKYYINEKNGKWDKSLLGMTELDVLLRLWKTTQ